MCPTLRCPTHHHSRHQRCLHPIPQDTSNKRLLRLLILETYHLPLLHWCPTILAMSSPLQDSITIKIGKFLLSLILFINLINVMNKFRKRDQMKFEISVTYYVSFGFLVYSYLSLKRVSLYRREFIYPSLNLISIMMVTIGNLLMNK